MWVLRKTCCKTKRNNGLEFIQLTLLNEIRLCCCDTNVNRLWHCLLVELLFGRPFNLFIHVIRLLWITELVFGCETSLRKKMITWGERHMRYSMNSISFSSTTFPKQGFERISIIHVSKVVICQMAWKLRDLWSPPCAEEPLASKRGRKRRKIKNEECDF